MSRYFFHRLVFIFPTLLGISILCFFLVQFTPGGPVESLISGWQSTAPITEAQKAALLSYYEFDKPILERYFIWIGKVFKLDFGQSYYFSEKVSQVILRALPTSLLLGSLTFLFSYLIALPLGICKALSADSLFDKASTVF